MENDNTEKANGARMVASAIIGLDYRPIIVNSKTYIINPPTIAMIAGATYFLCEFGDGNTLRQLLASLKNSENLAKALSWFIQGDDKLSEELSQGTMTEIIDGIEAAFSLIEAQNFMKLSALRKSAELLVAKQK